MPSQPPKDQPSPERHGSPRSAGVLKTVPADESGAALYRGVLSAVRSPYLPVLVIISGPDLGLRKVVDQSLLIGRDPACDFVLTDALVSSRHAMLEDRGDGFALVDLGSTNGTRVNRVRGHEFVLRPNDKVALGRTVIRFEVQDALEQAYDEQVARMLNIDDLSGLLVRRKFDRDLGTLLGAARTRGVQVGLLAMDLDGIKRINDTHGHLFGAYVIGESGRVIGSTLPPDAFAARFGGDEFIAALPGCGLAAAVEQAERIRLAIAEHPFEREGVDLHPGISIGVASFPESALVAETLFQKADEALYRAKRGGKNRVNT